MEKFKKFISPSFVSLCCLTGLGLLCFLPAVRHVGFYLDDWIMLDTLSSGPSEFIELFKYYFSADNRVVKRPLEAFHFLVMFKMFDLRPAGYHVFNLVMEIISAFLFYLCLAKITQKKFLSLICSALFLLYPSHNATHYWVVCSSVTLSLIFYFGSLLSNIEAELRGKVGLHWLSALFLLLGVLNYEVFLPLAALNVLFVFLIALKKFNFKKAIKSSSLVIALFGLSGIITKLYITWVVHLVGDAWLHIIQLDANLIINTFAKGFYVNLPWVVFEYCLNMIKVMFQFGVTNSDWTMLAFVGVCFCFSLFAFIKVDSNEASEIESSKGFFPLISGLEGKPSYNAAIWLAILGLFTIFVSYSIFGLNDSYQPTFITLVNRVNTGASIGVAFWYMSFMLVLHGWLGPKFKSESKFKSIVSLLAVSLVLIFTLTNWSLSRPYRLSWQLQAHIIKSIKAKSSQLKDVQSLLLINAPRYVDEAPVFDGVWDFQPMLRVTLDRPDINGGVLSERMKVNQESAIDSRGPMILGKYKFDGLSVLISPTCDLVKTKSAQDFIELVEKRGMNFEANKNLPNDWRKQLQECNQSN